MDALDKQPFGFNNRFEDEPGSNPEELVGAAHSACFSMALSLALGDAGFKADKIDTKATVRLLPSQFLLNLYKGRLDRSNGEVPLELIFFLKNHR